MVYELLPGVIVSSYCNWLASHKCFTEEQELPIDDQGALAVVIDTDQNVLCRVQDAKEYQHAVHGQDAAKSKSTKSKGKWKASTPLPDQLGRSDTEQNSDDLPMSYNTSHHVVTLMPAEKEWADIPETTVDFTDAQGSSEWIAAQEKRAAQVAELTWYKKGLADAEAKDGVFRDEGYYRLWKLKQVGQHGHKRTCDEDDLGESSANKRVKH